MAIKTENRVNIILIFLVAITFLCAAYNDCVLYDFHYIDDFIIRELSSPFYICYYLPFSFLLLWSLLYKKTIKKPLKTQIVRCAIKSLCFVICSIVILILAYLLYNGYKIRGEKVLIDSDNAMSVLEIILYSIFLNTLRLGFYYLCVSTLNLLTHKCIGFLSILVMVFIDRWAYECFNILYPIGITPIEHTAVFYVEAMAPAIPPYTRLPIGLSILYWLIAISLFILLKAVLMTRGIKNEFE